MQLGVMSRAKYYKKKKNLHLETQLQITTN